MSEGARLKAFIEYAPAAVAMFDSGMRYLAASGVWRELFAIAPDLSSGARDGLFFQLSESWRLAALRALTGEAVAARELCFGVDGCELWLDWRMQRWRTESGEVGGVVIFVQDVTSHRHIEDSLRQSQLDLARAQEVAQMGWWRLDTRRNVLTWSNENYRIFGKAPGRPLAYEDFLACVHPEDRAYVDDKWRAALRGASYDIEPPAY